MAEPTIFEKIISGEIPGNFVSRGSNWAAFLDVFPRSEGHTLVVPHRPVQRISDLSKDEITELFSGVQETQQKLSQYFGTTDFTVIVHDTFIGRSGNSACARTHYSETKGGRRRCSAFTIPKF